MVQPMAGGWDDLLPSQEQWSMPLSLVLRKLRQKDFFEFQSSLGYVARLSRKPQGKACHSGVPMVSCPIYSRLWVLSSVMKKRWRRKRILWPLDCLRLTVGKGDI